MFGVSTQTRSTIKGVECRHCGVKQMHEEEEDEDEEDKEEEEKEEEEEEEC